MIDYSHMDGEAASFREENGVPRAETWGGAGSGPARATRAKSEVGRSFQLQEPTLPHPHICLRGCSVPRSQGQGPGGGNGAEAQQQTLWGQPISPSATDRTQPWVAGWGSGAP